MNPLTKKYLGSIKGVLTLDEYDYTNQSGCIDVAGEDDVENLELVLQCMKNVQFSDTEIIYVFNIIAGILNLGNVNFTDSEKVEVTKES